MAKDKKRGLGRGLSALMADVAEAEAPVAQSAAGGVQFIPIEQIAPNPDQPRKQFTPDELEDLSRSIATKGIIQPLIVRAYDGGYQIVAGERRWRAAQMAQLHELPVVVREFTDIEVLEVAIIENVQREDLNPVDEAMAYKQLMDKFGHTQAQLSEALGKSRPHLANVLRLLQLPNDVLEMVKLGDLSSGHARALITSDDPLALAKQVVKNGLSVRATEQLVRKGAQPSDPNGTPNPKVNTRPQKDADTRALENDLTAGLSMKVVLNHAPGDDAGQMVIHYTSLEQLDDLCRKLSVE